MPHPPDGSYWFDLLRPEYQGRKFLVADEVLAGATAEVEFLKEIGAERPFVLAASRGVGPVPGRDDADVAIVPVAGDTVMAWFRNVERTWRDLPDDVVFRVDAWDPERSARVLMQFLFAAGTVAGRPTYGAREPAWLALEDKTRVNEVWDRAGIPRAPFRVVPLDPGQLAEASAQLDWGAGTAWVADNRDGWHGGAEMLRWVKAPDAAAEAFRYLADRADVVRVMPFLEGIPCAIHGMVFPEETAVARPIEMVVFEVPGTGRLHYSGTGSFWDPPARHREDMRHAARAVGEVLAVDYGYRGLFTIDGVLTVHGFLPTELNSRFGPGLGRAAQVIEHLPLLALHRTLIAGADLDYRPAALERLLVESIDASRVASGLMLVDEAPDEEIVVEVVFDDDAGACRSVEPDEAADASVAWGPGTSAGILRVTVDPARTPVGTSVAPRVGAALTFAAAHLGITIDELRPLGDVFG